jgi:flagellar motility protein MotE (MotC chaperone)
VTTKSLDPLRCLPSNIWQYRQNKPSRIARDLKDICGVPYEISMRILMARGVFKWLAVRRDLIKLKNVWRNEITELHRCLRHTRQFQKNSRERIKSAADYQTVKAEQRYQRSLKELEIRTSERIKTLEHCRAQVRALCHSERWRDVDFDRHTSLWMNTWEQE